MPTELTLYTRPGCHLCNTMKAVVQRVRRQQAFKLTELDVSADPALERRYGRDVPVLLIDGVEVARHRLDETELTRRLRGQPE